jgi:hypothetical protein
MNFGSVDSPGVTKALNKLAESLEQDNALRASVESIKKELDEGRLVTRDRQTGKTLALLEWIHEHDPANMIVVCCNGIMKSILRSRYREMYPRDPQPIFEPIQSISGHNLRGTNRKWMTDEVWPAAVVRRSLSYIGAEYAGGVGTPQCMDILSGEFLSYEEGEKPESPKSPVFTQTSNGRRRS